MDVLRALKKRRNQPGRYDKLQNDTMNINNTGTDSTGVLKRVASVPTQMVLGCLSPSPQPVGTARTATREGKGGNGKTHPLLSLFDGIITRKKKKKVVVTADPEYSRYVEYMKEGGVWNDVTGSPVIYYK